MFEFPLLPLRRVQSHLVASIRRQIFLCRNPSHISQFSTNHRVTMQESFLSVPIEYQNYPTGNGHHCSNEVLLDPEWNDHNGSCSFRLASWNVLAQALINRKLFPSASKQALRWASRSKLFTEAIPSLNADIFCLQEVDVVDEFWHALWDSNAYDYLHRYKQKGKHGCLIAWKRSQFQLIRSDWIHFDESPLTTPTHLFPNTGNIALLAEFQHIASEQRIIVTNHHLYWIPKGNYLRLRQLFVLFDKLQSWNPNHYPIFSCGGACRFSRSGTIHFQCQNSRSCFY
jgi:mRNA deadenylase 3'-5' endonuclease subunit Ccr4